MSENNLFIVIALCATACFGGLMKCGYEDEKTKHAAEQRRQSELARSRDGCISVGNAWINDNCIPRCVK